VVAAGSIVGPRIRIGGPALAVRKLRAGQLESGTRGAELIVGEMTANALRLWVAKRLRPAVRAATEGRITDATVSEPILVFRGPLHRDLHIFGQDANSIEIARQDRRGNHSELQDTDGNWLLAIEAESLASFETYVVTGPDGTQVGRLWRRAGSGL
jgi:hypothetical protein